MFAETLGLDLPSATRLAARQGSLARASSLVVRRNCLPLRASASGALPRPFVAVQHDDKNLSHRSNQFATAAIMRCSSAAEYGGGRRNAEGAESRPGLGRSGHKEAEATKKKTPAHTRQGQLARPRGQGRSDEPGNRPRICAALAPSRRTKSAGGWLAGPPTRHIDEIVRMR